MNVGAVWYKRVYREFRWSWAKQWMKFHENVKTICVGGSVGKTTTKDLINQVLKSRYKVVATDKNFDPIFNLPITVLKLKGTTERLIAEMSIDGVGQMEKYLSLIKPTVSVITRLSLEHTDAEHFGSLEVAVEEEWKLATAVSKQGLLIVNGDDELIKKKLDSYDGEYLTVGFGTKNKVKLSRFKTKIENGRLVSEFILKWGREKVLVRTGLMGKHNAILAATAMVVAGGDGIRLENSANSLKFFSPPWGRMNLVKTKWDGIAINDAYNASPVAMLAALESMKEVSPDFTLVMGDMRELGEYSKASHKEVGKAAFKVGVSKMILMGSEVEAVAQGYIEAGGNKKNVNIFYSVEEIGRELLKTKPGAFLLKGSRGMAMEGVLTDIQS